MNPVMHGPVQNGIIYHLHSGSYQVSTANRMPAGMPGLQFPQRSTPTSLSQNQVHGTSTGSLQQGLGHSISVNSLCTTGSDGAMTAVTPPRSRQTAMGLADVLQHNVAGTPISMTRDPSNASMASGQYPVSQAGRGHPAPPQQAGGVWRGTQAKQGPGPVTRELTPPVTPTWVIEEVIDFGPVHEEVSRDNDDSVDRLCDAHSVRGTIFERCLDLPCNTSTLEMDARGCPAFRDPHATLDVLGTRQAAKAGL